MQECAGSARERLFSAKSPAPIFLQKRSFCPGQALRQRPKIRPPRVKPKPKVPIAKPPIARHLRQVDRRCQRPSASRSSERERLPSALFSIAPPARRPR